MSKIIELKNKAEAIVDKFEKKLVESTLPTEFKARLTRSERALLLTFVMWFIESQTSEEG